MLRLINTMRDFAQLHGGHEERFVPTDLPELTANLASNFRSLIEKAGLQLVVRCPALPEPVYVDRTMWEQIVLHLIANAFEHTFTGEIGVTVRMRGTSAELIVRDTGVGIPAEQLPHMFERFHRIPNVKSRTTDGTGNGLALVRDLVKRHHGTVQIDSVVGSGTLVAVTLPFGVAHLPPDRVRQGSSSSARTPLGDETPSFVGEMLQWMPEPQETPDSSPVAAPPLPAASPPPMASGTPRRERVLIADDNADMRQFLIGLLSPRYDVEAVADGVAALASIRERVPDLVLSDVMMPKLDGLGLLRELRSDPRTRAVSIVLVSARIEEESRAEGLDVGADDYLEKPFTARELVARVNSNLRLARMRREIIEQQNRALVAETANAAKTQFLTTMSHELRTPLNAITGYVDLLEMELYGPITGEQRQSLTRIRHSGQHLLALINDVLNFSQMEAGQMRYHLQDVAVQTILERLGTLIEPQASKKQIVYAYEPCPTEAPVVHTDPDRLTQIVLNLLSNAIKFTEPGGRVTLSCSVSHAGAKSEMAWNRLHIRVSDTGCGIPAEKRDSIFEPFVQLDRHLVRESQQGVGLGLSISRDLALNLGGDIAVESAEGKGSTFTLTLPRTGAPMPAGAEPRGADRASAFSASFSRQPIPR
jgi:signal transduction histidine kinase